MKGTHQRVFPGVGELARCRVGYYGGVGIQLNPYSKESQKAFWVQRKEHGFNDGA
jgi:hypothetical protein